MANNVPTVALDLGAPPEERWACVGDYVERARSLVDFYLRDLSAVGLAEWRPLLSDYRRDFIAASINSEVKGIAKRIGRTEEEVLVGNLYYDAFRLLMGCTAFAVDASGGPIHARNLDWWSDGDLLSRSTWCVCAAGGRAVDAYTTVGWPGFVGAFSGIAAGRFAITMNAVLSTDRRELGESIGLLIRDVLETAPSFDAAVHRLQTTKIAADCLLLVTGAKPGELVVIERTPTRTALRHPSGGVLAVTNDYRALAADSGGRSELSLTACDRFDRAIALAVRDRPGDAAACFRVLADDRVRMGITVQHMVMRASTGELAVRLPA